MLLTLPEEVRQLLHLVQHHVFMIYQDEDKEYYFLFSEGMIAEQFSIPTKTVRNKTLKAVFTTETYAVFYPNIVKAFEGESIQFEARYNDRIMLVSLEPVKRDRTHNEIEEIMGSAFDITTQKKAEEELRTALEQERHLNILKSRFIYTVSHEFRTPLTGISVASELLQHYYERMDSENRLKNIQSIRKRTDELTTLIESLLTQSSAESLSSMYKPVIIEPSIVCDEIIRDFQDTFDPPTHKIEFDFESYLPEVQWDKRLMKHIIRNLLSNAIKYSKEGTVINLLLSHKEDTVILEVRDNGVGISDEDLQHIFTPFFRSYRTETIKGTGLGLSIVKEFVEMHGGKIDAESILGAGTTFKMQFPVTVKHDAIKHSNGIHRNQHELVLV
ncbi:MAG: HAMP domain-containing histidine kinase [Ignavibacteriae bacterium]|nr:HAMP domain-containing histidine kinase [Ignavibacteriota bacterium]